MRSWLQHMVASHRDRSCRRWFGQFCPVVAGGGGTCAFPALGTEEVRGFPLLPLGQNYLIGGRGKPCASPVPGAGKARVFPLPHIGQLCPSGSCGETLCTRTWGQAPPSKSNVRGKLASLLA